MTNLPGGGVAESGIARNGEVEIAYEVFGRPGGRPLVLLNGLDGTMLGWAEGFCAALAEAGFQVVRYDHRDAGLSTHFTGRGRAYRVGDMVDDMIAVQDTLGWESAHLCGLSMGAGLAQFAALRNPGRVRSLTLMSPIRMVGADFASLRYVRLPGPLKIVFKKYGKTPEDKVRMLMDIMRLTEARSMPLDEASVRETAERAVRRRMPDPDAGMRVRAARRAERPPAGGIRGITQPTLVISGAEDPLINPRAGAALAKKIPGARYVLVERMGHTFAPGLWPRLVGEIERHTS
ncbi:alpha/beta fold hydrolase [Streptosporangium sp. DT93]|uniref:alpha/beta fold hydrolase n=1 Tax=Streptosporangium sp. DT93 TaxID=3393428 RepID=UPI003CEF80E1